MDVVLRWITDAAGEELAAVELWDRGATAVAVEPAPGGVALVASFPTAAATREVAAAVGAAVEEVPGDWREAWKAWAEPIEVGDLVVAPAWRPVPVADGRLVVEIDPGPCFGSGSHASTRLLLGLLAEEPPVGCAVLDAGTGSGILAVAAALLGAGRVRAVDIDPAAVTAARRNAERNGVGGRVEASTTRIEELAADHDLALVNLTAGVHAELGAAVAAAVRPGGRLWLAGLLPGQWGHVAGAYRGCRLLAQPELDGWVGAVLERG